MKYFLFNFIFYNVKTVFILEVQVKIAVVGVKKKQPENNKFFQC